MNHFCDRCGLYAVSLYPMQRPNGDQHWLCSHCSKRVYGATPVDVAQQVAREREVHAGGPRVLQSS